MKLRYSVLAALAVLAATPAAFAQTLTTVVLVNGTGSDISAMQSRRSGSSQWSGMPYSARAGGSGAASFDTQDCAWDFKVTVADGATLTFSNVNLCEAKLLTLRRKDGVVWVDYD